MTRPFFLVVREGRIDMNARLRVNAMIASLMTLAVACAWAQPSMESVYPSRPIRILVGFSPGSTTDILARLTGQKMSETWGQPVVVENRPSAGGVLASGIVASANPDGYSLLSVSAGHAVSAA